MIKAIVTDIEGTTSSLAFVKDVLFPYARRQLPDFIRHHAAEPEVAGLLAEASAVLGGTVTTEQLIDQFIAWIDNDQKITPLKSLQGLIWAHGYAQGDFKGHIYADAALQLQAFKARGYCLYIYSSGSVYAQKLLFAHTEYGDLTPLFSGYFDTHIGAKQDVDSYRRIAEQLQLPAAEILFLSDIKAELDAARQAGFNTYWLVRGETIDSQAEHRQVGSFDQIDL